MYMYKNKDFYISCIRQPPIFKGCFFTLRVVLYTKIYGNSLQKIDFDL